ncbi:biopolymer transporter ExbD [Bacteroidales bacterium OttesenSCG-928-L03]|nr:biopolymer transporter ExbD [Bacteroidales bacterium OttesenSCG-928-L03]
MRRKRKIPQINSSASADIAFLLLIFFLITSSLDPRTGFYQHLETEKNEAALSERQEVLDRNLLTFTLDDRGDILYKDSLILRENIRSLSKTFIDNPNNRDFLPEKVMTEVPILGSLAITVNHIIYLKISPKADYQSYISLLNEVTAAYNELRNERSYESFNAPFTRLTADQQEAVRQVYPLRIAEKEIEEGGLP